MSSPSRTRTSQRCLHDGGILMKRGFIFPPVSQVMNYRPLLGGRAHLSFVPLPLRSSFHCGPGTKGLCRVPRGSERERKADLATRAWGCVRTILTGVPGRFSLGTRQETSPGGAGGKKTPASIDLSGFMFLGTSHARVRLEEDSGRQGRGVLWHSPAGQKALLLWASRAAGLGPPTGPSLKPHLSPLSPPLERF